MYNLPVFLILYKFRKHLQTVSLSHDNLLIFLNGIQSQSFLAIAGFSQLSGPMAGFFSDRSNADGGRRRPFIIWGTLVGFVGILALWWAHRNLAIKVYFFVFFIAMLALNVIYVAYR